MKLKEAMKAAKETGKRTKVSEPTPVAEAKVNISIRLDLDVLNWLKRESKKQGIPYQTFANSILKKASTSQSIEERLAKIEDVVFKGKTG